MVEKFTPIYLSLLTSTQSTTSVVAQAQLTTFVVDLVSLSTVTTAPVSIDSQSPTSTAAQLTATTLTESTFTQLHGPLNATSNNILYVTCMHATISFCLPFVITYFVLFFFSFSKGIVTEWLLSVCNRIEHVFQKQLIQPQHFIFGT